MSYYAPPPKNSGSSVTAWVFVGLLAVVGLLGLGIFAIVRTYHPTPHFSIAEQEFLSELKNERSGATWPADPELVGQAHEICTLQDTGVNRDALIETPLVGRPMIPDFLQGYSYEDRRELVYTATRHLCSQHSLWIGGVPISMRS